MPMLTDKPCPECGSELEERLDSVGVFFKRDVIEVVAEGSGRFDRIEVRAKDYRCLNGHRWLLVR